MGRNKERHPLCVDLSRIRAEHDRAVLLSRPREVGRVHRIPQGLEAKRRQQPVSYTHLIEDPAEREELVEPLIEAAIADADAEIDGYLAKRYTVPSSPAPRVLNKFSKDIAVYNLFSRIGIDESTDQKTYLNRYNAAIKFLTLVAEGKVSIGTETEDPASAAATGFSAKSNPRLFTRAKMRGM